MIAYFRFICKKFPNLVIFDKKRENHFISFMHFATVGAAEPSYNQ
jgi:hypothetical protein